MLGKIHRENLEACIYVSPILVAHREKETIKVDGLYGEPLETNKLESEKKAFLYLSWKKAALLLLILSIILILAITQIDKDRHDKTCE